MKDANAILAQAPGKKTNKTTILLDFFQFRFIFIIWIIEKKLFDLKF